MENKAKSWTIGGSIATVAVAVGLWTSLDPWPKIGWKTPNQHNADLARIEAEHDADIANTQTGLQIFRDEWICKGWRDELTALYDELSTVENRNQRLRDQIAGQREKMDDTKCDRFGRY